MRNGHLFVTAAKFGKTTLYVLDPVTGERIWERTFNMTDTHDADLVNGGEEILIANMRNYDATNGTNEDRILLYNRTRDEVVWEWEFDDHYNRSVGGDYDDDWSHVNDVDRVGEGRYLVSPRNFDQVIVVNRTTGDIDLRLGENRNHRILRQQHNPDYLETNQGRPTMLVADSENDRIVEYSRADGEWNRTWTLGNRSTLNWPRDADRLPNGNTLVTDSRNHRVFEVTPDGEIVWEVYTPWLPYDAERVRYGGSSRGPTIADLGAAGDPPLRASAGGHRDASTLERCAAAIGNQTRGNVSLTVVPYTRPDPSPTATASPPQGGSNVSGPGFGVLAALVAVVAWAAFARRGHD
jgi:PGF-CTERM protein